MAAKPAQSVEHQPDREAQYPSQMGLYERQLEIGDIEAMIEFDNKFFFDSEVPADHRPPELTPDLVKAGLERGDDIKGYFDDKGDYAAVRWFVTKPDEHELYIFSILIHPDKRSQGLADYLLVEAEAIARGKELDKCTLAVDPLNSRAINLYFKRGYRAVRYLEDRDEIDGLNNWLFMEKYLKKEIQLSGKKLIVAAGDEKGLREALVAGYVGHTMDRDKSDDPRENRIHFAVPQEQMPVPEAA